MTAPARAGDFRLRVDIQQRNATPDTVGGTTDVWSRVATVWAALTELSTGEKIAGQATASQVTHKLLIRYQPQFADPRVMASLRVVLAKDGVTRLFNIKGAHDDEERRRLLVLDVEEGMNEG